MAERERPKAALDLSDVERKTLLSWSRQAKAALVLRARIVLTCAESGHRRPGHGPAARAMVLAVNEKTQMQALDRSAPVLPMMSATPYRLTHDYIRHGTTSRSAALQVATGTLIGQHQRRRHHQEFLRVLKTIDANTPAEVDLHLICNNCATQKTPAIQRSLVKHPRFRLHFTPTYASWLNIMERWFAELTNGKLRRAAHHTVKALEADVTAWINAWNANPKPFVWTKTADKILEGLTGYLTRLNKSINGSGH